MSDESDMIYKRLARKFGASATFRTIAGCCWPRDLEGEKTLGGLLRRGGALKLHAIDFARDVAWRMEYAGGCPW